jgi:SHS2 domain-containing protein
MKTKNNDSNITNSNEMELDKKKYEFLEHTADIYVASYGKNLSEVFENAALALFDVMTDVKKIDRKFVEKVKVKGQDDFALLYNWLECFILKFEIENKLFSKFKVNEIKMKNSEFYLKASIYGECFNPRKHPSKVGIKAITYHNMKIEHNGYFVAKFLLDI